MISETDMLGVGGRHGWKAMSKCVDVEGPDCHLAGAEKVEMRGKWAERRKRERERE